MNNISGIYKIENKINGKCYIGSSKNVENRWKRHLSVLSNNSHYNTHLQRAVDIYGLDNFAFSIIMNCNIDDLAHYETAYIEEFDSYASGYNQTQTGYPFSEESIKQMTRDRKGKRLSDTHKQNISDSLKGRVVTEETRQKISIANKGKKRTDDFRKESAERASNPTEETIQKKSESRATKLDKYRVREIKTLLKTTSMTQKEIAEMFNVDGSHISDIKRGARWAWVKI